MSKVISPQKVCESLNQYWSPKIIGEVDNNFVKVAKLKGEFCWHTHEDEDELFYVLKGSLQILLKDETVNLNEGDMYVVPKGVEHKPIAENECQVLLFERQSTLHTGGVESELTKSVEQQRV